jgi:hypothetical protein
MQGFDGRSYLKIDISNNFGNDKLSWNDRLAWFEQNEPNLESLHEQAAEPALFYAGVQAYRAVQRGEAIGYPISLDATASGMQLLACLTGDRKAGEICNVVNTGNREDAYTSIWQTMQQKLGSAIKITRQQAKDAVMPALYSSKKAPEDVFGKGTQTLALFYETMEELAPAAWELNQAFLDIWDPDRLVYEWVMPDNFHVKVKVMDHVTEKAIFLTQPFDIPRKVNKTMKQGRSLSANTVHAADGMIVREMVRRCSYNPKQIDLIRDICQGGDYAADFETPEDQMVFTLWELYAKSGFLSARILDHLTYNNAGHVNLDTIQELIDSLPKKPFQVIAIHDAFRCLASYGNDLRQQYRLQLHLIAKSEMLSFLLTQIVGRDVKIGKLDPTMANDILNAEYALS